MVLLITLSGLFKNHFCNQFQFGSCNLDLAFSAKPGSKLGEEGEMSAGKDNVQNTEEESIHRSSEIRNKDDNADNSEEVGGMDELD